MKLIEEASKVWYRNFSKTQINACSENRENRESGIIKIGILDDFESSASQPGLISTY